MLIARKNGREIRLELPRGRWFEPPQGYEPLSPDRIIGIDTETFHDRGALTTKWVPIHYYNEARLLEIQEGESPLVRLFDELFPRFSVQEPRPSRTRQRPKRLRQDGRIQRDGRRQTVEPVLLVFYNAEYDLSRMVQDHESIIRAVMMGSDSVVVNVKEYELEIDYLIPYGSAPSFQWYVRRDGHVMRLLGRDMWGYWKQGLAKVAQALAPLGVTSKIAISDNVDGWTTREFETFSESELEELKAYALTDAKTTREIYLATVELLRQIDANVIRRDGTIPPSAPGAAARIAFSMAHRRWKKPLQWVNQFGLSAYCGGRVFSLMRGEVEGLHVLDITSAYPDAMRWLPDPVTVHYLHAPEGAYNHEFYRGKWGVLIVDGEGLDPYYPPLRTHGADGKLDYIYGRFYNIAATIPEIVIGVESGRLRIDYVRGGVIMDGTYEDSFLRKFVHKVFRIKEESKKGSPMYETSKLLMNSLYGKLIEMNAKTSMALDADGYFMLPNWVDIDQRKEELERIYVREGLPGLERIIQQGYENGWPVNESMPEIMLQNLFQSTIYKPGHYFLPLHASQVTGFVSAKLGLAAWATNAIQGDTDSIFTHDPSGLERYYEIMEAARYPAPRQGLGSWDHEIENAAGIILKTKMYSLKYHDNQGKLRWKQAHHAILRPRIPGGDRLTPEDRREREREAIHEIMCRLLAYSEARYVAKARPRRLRDAIRRGLTPGEFYEEPRVIKLIEDDRLILENGRYRWRNYASILADRRCKS